MTDSGTPVTTMPVQSAEAEGTAIFGDEQDVPVSRAAALPLVGALVAVGVVVGVTFGIVAVVTAPVWSVAIGSLVAGQQAAPSGAAETPGGDAAVLLELPADADVITAGYAEIDGQQQSVAQIGFSEDPAMLLESSGYSASPDVPADLLAAQGADFADPRFYVVFIGDNAFTALVGSTSDGRYLVALTGPVLATG